MLSYRASRKDSNIGGDGLPGLGRGSSYSRGSMVDGVGDGDGWGDGVGDGDGDGWGFGVRKM